MEAVKRFTPPTDGFIWLAEAYPEDEDVIVFQLMYTEEVATKTEDKKLRRFFLDKSTARILAEGIIGVLAAPDTKTAWERIANHEEHEEPDFEDTPPAK